MTLMKVILFEGVREAGEWNVAARSQTQWVPAALAANIPAIAWAACLQGGACLQRELLF